MIDRETEATNYLCILMDIAEKLNIDEVLLDYLVIKLAKNERIYDDDALREMSLSMHEIMMYGQNQRLRLKHRPNVVDEALQSFNDPSEWQIENLSDLETSILHEMVRKDNSDKPIQLHLDAITYSRYNIQWLKEDYAVNSLQMFVDVSLNPNCLQPAIDQYKVLHPELNKN